MSLQPAGQRRDVNAWDQRVCNLAGDRCPLLILGLTAILGSKNPLVEEVLSELDMLVLAAFACHLPRGFVYRRAPCETLEPLRSCQLYLP